MIKYTITLVLLVLYGFTSIAQGIEFFEGSWEEAQVKAMEEEKLIFVDAYTTWCGPCKRMAKNVFTQEEVGDYYNSNYISLKLDMETPKGRSFGGEYPVTAYPTLLFLNDKGELLKRVVGGKSAEQFLSIGQDVWQSYDRSSDLAALYEEGNRDFDLVLKYVKALNNANKSSLKIANDFLREKKDLKEDQKAQFLYEAISAADSRIFDLFVKNRNSISKLVGKEKVEEKIEEACWKTIQNAIDFESEMLLSEAKLKMTEHMKDKAKSFSFSADYEFAKARADIALLNSSALLLADKIVKKDAEKLHDICNELLLYKSIDISVLQPSEKIAKMAVDNEENTEYLLTYSKILSANNKTKKALKSARKALSLAGNKNEQQRAQDWLNTLESK